MARKTFQVTRVLGTRTDGSEWVAVPGLVLTLAELQACVNDAGRGKTHQVWCEICGESVADCPQARELLHGVPAEWSTYAMAE